MTARDRTIVLVLAAVAAIAGFWFLALKPKHAEAQALDAQVTQQQTRLQTAQTALGAGAAAKASYPRNAATVAELGKAIPADEDVPTLLYQLESVSHDAKVTFDSIERSAAAAPTSGTPTATGAVSAALPPGTTVGSAGLVTAPFKLKFGGSYFDLQRFIEDVQQFVRTKGDTVNVGGRLLTIDGVALTAGDKGLKKLQASIVATAYLSPTTSGSTSTSGGTTTTPGTGTSTPPASTTTAITGGTN